MIELKKYANGQFFDSINKKYVKVAALKEMIQKGEEIKITLAKTGKDITASVVEKFTEKKEAEKKKKKNKKTDSRNDKEKSSFLNTENLKKWAGKIIDSQISNVLDSIKLPSRKQIEELDANIKALNEKIDKLEALQKKKCARKKPAKQAAPDEVQVNEESETASSGTDTE